MHGERKTKRRNEGEWQISEEEKTAGSAEEEKAIQSTGEMERGARRFYCKEKQVGSGDQSDHFYALIVLAPSQDDAVSDWNAGEFLCAHVSVISFGAGRRVQKKWEEIV